MIEDPQNLHLRPGVSIRIPLPTTKPETIDAGTVPARCVGCFRPPSLCYCEAIPAIDNQTDILIVQHIRERDHPFNTARMVHRALAKSQLVCGTKAGLMAKRLKLTSNAGLLFPTTDAIELSHLSPQARPNQLVVVDGTWTQAKSIVKALPQLQSLPCYKLAPTQPGQYRIRLEPTDTSLSTVEAAVAALQALEPETKHLDQLLIAFEVMVQKQLDHPAVDTEHYSGGPTSGRTFNVPKRLFGDPAKIVVAYGEASYRAPDQPRNIKRSPVYWSAENLGTGERFNTAIESPQPLTGTFLKHLELPPGVLESAITTREFCQRWRSFFGQAELLVVYNQGTIRLMQSAFDSVDLPGSIATAFLPNYETLKSINFEGVPSRSLPELISALGIEIPPWADDSSRAEKRLAGTIALLKYLRGNVSANYRESHRGENKR